ncbi:glycosyltransferase family 2 protein [Bacteroides timonensis]|uniref:glycosyltransferase family 2 protein n=1 Tax=Bacteroides timonensis TaxID=1470345 RepID=UPI0004BBE3EB|nr:glycosyltransferase family 2 protein [Bacteroides timonensis]
MIDEKFPSEEYPVISVIVPVYNKEDVLARCVESILGQSFATFELILVNDGSTDYSGVLCNELAIHDVRIRVLHQKNSGVSAARNNGLDCAKGKYIVFIDPDDWVKEDYLYHLLDSASGKSGRGLVIQGFLKYISDEESYALRGMKFEKLYAETLDEIRRLIAGQDLGKCGFPFSKLYNKSLLDDYHIRFDERIYFCEDLLFMYDYLLHIDFLVLGDSQDYVYVVYPSSLSAKLHGFDMQYLCFVEYQQRLSAIASQFKLSWSAFPLLTNAMMEDVFERALKTDYQSYHAERIIQKERLVHLKHLVDNNYNVIYQYYHPVCKSDCLGKFFLVWRCYRIYDIYMCVLFWLKFVPVYYGPIRNNVRFQESKKVIRRKEDGLV